MVDREVDGPLRLRGAGVGSIAGGVALGLLSLLGVPYVPASIVVLASGVVAWVWEDRRDSWSGSRPSVGLVAVGAIGAIEATATLGIYLGPLLLAALAIGAGVVDILLGSVAEQLRSDPD